MEDTSSSSAEQIFHGSIPTENFDSLDWHTISQMLFFFKHDWMPKRKSPHHFFSELLDVLFFFMSLNVFTASSFRCQARKNPAICRGVRKLSFSDTGAIAVLSSSHCFEMLAGSAFFPVRSPSWNTSGTRFSE